MKPLLKILLPSTILVLSLGCSQKQSGSVQSHGSIPLELSSDDATLLEHLNQAHLDLIAATLDLSGHADPAPAAQSLRVRSLAQFAPGAACKASTWEDPATNFTADWGGHARYPNF